jgi:hypothetical protein
MSMAHRHDYGGAYPKTETLALFGQMALGYEVAAEQVQRAITALQSHGYSQAEALEAVGAFVRCGVAVRERRLAS